MKVNIMRVLFLNPPWYKLPEDGHEGWRGVRAGSRWPHTFTVDNACEKDGILPGLLGGYLPFPFWLATAGALAKQRGFEAYVRDSIALGETYDNFYSFVDSYNADVIVIETASATLKHDLAIANKIKNSHPLCVVVFTGLHIELEDKSFLERTPVIDYIVYGEYEASVVKLLEVVRDGVSDRLLSEIPGILFRSELLGVVKTEFGELIGLDSLPWAEREDGLPALNYFDGVCGLPRPQLQLMSTRGCPYGCIFCVWPQMFYKSGKYRKRTPQDVVGEIKANLQQVPYKSFYIDDDTFNMSKASVIALAKAITDAGLNTIPWATMGRADRIDDEQLDALVEAGLYSIKYGVESAEQSILDASEKYIDINKVISGIQKTSARGIKVHLTFTFGLPGDTIETIEKTIDLACELPCDTVQFSIATPYPGTRMYEMYKEAGWLQSENWEDYVGSTKAVSRTENFTGEQLEFYVHEAYRRFNLSRQVKKFHDGNYAQTLCDGLLDRGISKDKRIVLLQCANITFSKLVLTALKNNGWNVNVFTHERFVDDISAVIDAPHIITFNNVKNFDYQNLHSQLSSLIDNGCIVFAPCSNNDGSGYEEVRKLMTLSPAPSVMFTMEGTFI